MIIGRGGTDVEERRDFTTLLLPAGTAQIREALKKLDISRRINMSDNDTQRLTDTIIRIAEFASQYHDRLDELDVNPIILDASGEVTAVDTFIRLVP